MEEMDWHALHCAESTVDTAYGFVDCRSEILVLFDVLTRGNRYLDEDHLEL